MVAIDNKIEQAMVGDSYLRCISVVVLWHKMRISFQQKKNNFMFSMESFYEGKGGNIRLKRKRSFTF